MNNPRTIPPHATDTTHGPATPVHGLFHPSRPVRRSLSALGMTPEVCPRDTRVQRLVTQLSRCSRVLLDEWQLAV